MSDRDSIVRTLQQALDSAGVTSAVRPETSDDTPLGVTSYVVNPPTPRYRPSYSYSYEVIRVGLSPEEAIRLANLLAVLGAVFKETDINEPLLMDPDAMPDGDT